MCNPKLNQNVGTSIISTILGCWLLLSDQMSEDFKASIPRSTTEMSPKQCVFSSLLNIWCSQFRSALNQRNSREGWNALACSNFSFFENRWYQGKVLKVSRKTWEDFPFPLYGVLSWVSWVKLVSLLHEIKMRSHHQVSWNLYTLRKKDLPSLTRRPCGFLVCLTCRLRVSCKPLRNVFSRPFCLSGCFVFRHFRAKHCKFSHHPDSPTAVQMP